jgi:hypothetical protein
VSNDVPGYSPSAVDDSIQMSYLSQRSWCFPQHVESHDEYDRNGQNAHNPANELCPARVGNTIVLDTIPLDKISQNDSLVQTKSLSTSTMKFVWCIMLTTRK